MRLKANPFIFVVVVVVVVVVAALVVELGCFPVQCLNWEWTQISKRRLSKQAGIFPMGKWDQHFKSRMMLSVAFIFNFDLSCASGNRLWWTASSQYRCWPPNGYARVLWSCCSSNVTCIEPDIKAIIWTTGALGHLSLCAASAVTYRWVLK